MSTKEQIEHVFMILFKIFLLLLIVFLFICTLGLLSDAFQLIGGKGLGNTIKKSQFLQNPISATIIGMVISLVLQSSSTLISLLVSCICYRTYY
jgi:sodium-dependent phosphate cotransporter